VVSGDPVTDFSIFVLVLFSMVCLCFLCFAYAFCVLGLVISFVFFRNIIVSGTNMIRINLTSQIYDPVLHILVANLLGG